MNRPFDLLIVDLDNTIYDWERFYLPSFNAMASEVAAEAGLDLDDVMASFRRVYQKHRTTEYAFAIQELDVLSHIAPATRLQVFDKAIHAFRSTRKRLLTLYPGVRPTLAAARKAGLLIAAHSDSPVEYVSRRLRQLNVDEEFSVISAPHDHGVPPGVRRRDVRKAPDGEVLSRGVTLPYDPSLRKPDIRTLRPILDWYGGPASRALYVGDNLSRDMLLASRAGLTAVWARYGAVHDPALRAVLLKITYWTDADVSAEAVLRAEALANPPTYVIDRFSQLRSILGLSSRTDRARSACRDGVPSD